MTTTDTRPPLAAHRRRLEAILRDSELRLARIRADYEALAEVGEDVGAGEEDGGSEGNQTMVERDRLRAAAASEEASIAEAEAALARAGSKTWSQCGRCGGEIGAARLEAIPTADRCVSCKAAGDSW